jgi:nucleotide-binding universal stress UspA family protein
MNKTQPLSQPSDPQLARQYSSSTTEWEAQPTAATATRTATATRVGPAPLFLVVGFDGSKPARRALDSASGLLHDREGALEVVYVAHVPPGAALSSDAMVEVENALDDQEARLAGEVRSQLQASEPRWHFQRRNGAVPQELIAVADELRRQHGPEARVAVVVGGSAHKYHRFVGSVSMNLERVDRFPVLVVP